MLWERGRYHCLGMETLVYGLGTRTLLLFGHGCSGDRMLLEHESCYGVGMDTLVTVCSLFLCDPMLWEDERYYGLGVVALVSAFIKRWTASWFGHICSRDRMLLEHKRHYGLRMDALVTVCSWNLELIRQRPLTPQ